MMSIHSKSANEEQKDGQSNLPRLNQTCGPFLGQNATSVFDHLRSEASLAEWTEEAIEKECLEVVSEEMPLALWLHLKKIVHAVNE
jgi:hypothetical protein